MTPHEKDCKCTLCKAETAINALTNEEIAELPVWKAWEYAFPHGTVTEVASSMGLPPTTLESWTKNPESVATTGSDAGGRRGLGYEFISCLLFLNGVFSPGARFLLRYYSLKVGKGETIKGHKQMQAVMELAGEGKALADEARAFAERTRAFEEKIAAFSGMGKT
jgi:hypothetical protein